MARNKERGLGIPMPSDARVPGAAYEFCSPQIGRGPDVDSPYDPSVAAKDIYERTQSGWEFLQVYTVVEPRKTYMGTVSVATVFALFRREKQ